MERIYEYEDVFHCEPIIKVADDFINRNNIPTGNFDNVASCIYDVPGYWEIGEVFERIIEDNYELEDVFVGIREVYSSFLAEEICNFNTDLYYQPRDYLSECYRAGEILVS